MIQLKETAGDTLVGVIDGTNITYEVSFDFNPDTVNIYVNGRLKIRDWDDGFVVLSPRTVKMKEPLLPGDSLEVEYKSDTRTGGGALGGVPGAPITDVLTPGLEGQQYLPDATAETMEATAVSESVRPSTLVDNLHPVIIASN